MSANGMKASSFEAKTDIIQLFNKCDLCGNIPGSHDFSFLKKIKQLISLDSRKYV
jgi:hypothetical protein